MLWLFTIFLILLILTDSSWSNADGCVGVEPKYRKREIGVDQIPYIVYMEFTSMAHVNQKPYHATGIIIDRNMVLTLAYHCETAKSETFKVYAGQTYINPKIDEMRVIDYKIHPARGRLPYDQSKTLHGYFNMAPMNFCLLKLDHDFEFNENVQMAALPLPNDTLSMDVEYLTAGWGPYSDREFIQGKLGMRASSDFTKSSLFHNYAKVTDPVKCDGNLGLKDLRITEDLFCLGWDCKDYHTAYGDDGGPVVNPITPVVVGMVINWRELDKAAKPQPNVNLAYGVEWINEVRKEWTLVEVNPNVTTTVAPKRKPRLV